MPKVGALGERDLSTSFVVIKAIKKWIINMNKTFLRDGSNSTSMLNL